MADLRTTRDTLSPEDQMNERDPVTAADPRESRVDRFDQNEMDRTNARASYANVIDSDNGTARESVFDRDNRRYDETAVDASRMDNALERDRVRGVEDNTRAPLNASLDPLGTASANDRNDSAAAHEQAEQNPDTTPLFSNFELNDLRTRWSNVQAGFVDSPRHSVEQADQLVAAVMQRIADSFAEERTTLERQWEHGDNVSTEDLRVALQRYRSFFGRLLNAA